MPRLRVVLRVCFCWRIRAAQGHSQHTPRCRFRVTVGLAPAAGGAHGAESGPSAGMGMTMIPLFMIPGKSGIAPDDPPSPANREWDRDEDGDGGHWQLAASADLVAWIVAIIVANSIPSSL